MVNTPESRDSDTYRGGRSLRLEYTREQYDATGPGDASEILDWADTALWALAALRSPEHTWGEGLPFAHPADTTDWAIVISDLRHLHGKIGAILQHALAQHDAAGGSISQAAAALNVPRSTAQSQVQGARWTTGQPGPVNDWITARPAR